METVLVFTQTYADGILLGIQLVMVILLCVVIHKISVTKRKMDKITKAVEGYLSVIMEEDLSSAGKASDTGYADETAENLKQQQIEEQNRLISAVLQEIFP